ncbi:arsenic metallochaperone ArsD family protein [Solwaraspora sp. WMMD792]|uniref:arsenic metallochaperone ArsD family protein n=1 Tax=Solwaraspora sp. WMMD792 TaxID=3016099 RepID=UPI002415E19F|nr:arsenic metallochaperone ArsD family protein [Solwaraspora sp. WMMD792]MDG4771684.1 arsenic metallochaperone ArsD family protein [Solwaraspora sp. WMMD792]
MAFNVSTVQNDLRLFTEAGLLAAQEAEQVLEVISDAFPFAQAMDNAESIHVHVNADDVANLPVGQRLADACQETSNSAQERKFSFPSGLNVIFASEPTAQDEFIPGAAPPVKPYVDHLGVDLREENAATQRIFDAIPDAASSAGWRHVYQAGPVRCCHTMMGPKHWVYPPEGAQGSRRPIEFAFGDLHSSDEYLGCDYRPIDPAHPLAAKAGELLADCGPSAAPAVTAVATRPVSTPVKIYVFEECSCNTTPSQPLLDVLQERYPSADIKAFDMAKPTGMVPLPPALFLALQTEGSRCLPALVVDGKVRTQGWLPTPDAAAELIDDPDHASAPLRRPASAADACCTTDACC